MLAIAGLTASVIPTEPDDNIQPNHTPFTRNARDAPASLVARPAKDPRRSS